MKKHAYCIIAHKNWWQLTVLLRLLDDNRNDIYVHIDKKVKNLEKDVLVNSCQKSKIEIYQDVAVAWGGYSQVECELSLFEHAFRHSVDNNSYDYYHLISGLDLPLKNQNEIHAFFENHNDCNFMRYDDEYAKSDRCIGRVRYYNFAYNINNRYIRKPFIFIDKCIRKIQRVMKVDRMKYFPNTLYFGSNWVSLKEEAVKILLENKQNFRKYYKFTSCADELYKHTVLRESGVKFYSLDKDYVKSCLRYIDFSDHKPNPKVFTINDYEKLMDSGALFARKFDENIDKAIIEKIASEITAQ